MLQASSSPLAGKQETEASARIDSSIQTESQVSDVYCLNAIKTQVVTFFGVVGIIGV
jgi:hypothetical protein